MANWKTLFKDLTNLHKLASNPINYIAGQGIKAAVNSNAAKEIGKAVTDRYGVSQTTSTTNNIKASTPTIYTSKGVTNKKSTAPTLSKSSGSGSTVSSSSTGGSGGSSGGGGTTTLSSYETAVKPYLDQILAAYNQGADASNTLAQFQYDTGLENLAETLNRSEQTYNQKIRDLDTLLGRYEQDYGVSIKNLDEALRRAQGTYDTGATNARESYNVTESNLKRALERFQAQNAKDVENQRKSYLTDQAALESARLEADRQTRIDAAARGLGGSGLQQLAQLQNLLNQGQDISNLATENQGVLDKLRTQLAEAEEDTATDIADAARTRDNTLNALLTALDNAKVSDKLGREEALRTLTNARADVETERSDALTAWQNAQGEYNRGKKTLLDTLTASKQSIAADLADKIAKANYDFGSNNYSAIQAEKAAAAANAARSSASNNANALLDYYRLDLQDSLDSLGSMDSETLSNLKTSLGLGSKATIDQVADKLVNQSLGYGASVSGISPNQLSTYNTSLRDIRNNANLNNTNAKKSSLLDYITGAIRG